MGKIQYVRIPFKPATLDLIEKCNKVIDSYQDQGYLLTLRQLYYRLVAAGVIENTENSYKRIGDTLLNARMAGLVDWDAIEDRTRDHMAIAHGTSPNETLHGAARGYRIDKWVDQKIRPEIWVEKEALAGVVERVASQNDVGYVCCRGYMSASEMHESAMRFLRRHQNGQATQVIYLGDHDPSGIDMTRDVFDRISLFMEYHLKGSSSSVNRIALTMDQIKKYEPPPNPAKVSDSRFLAYQDAYGDDSWELDSLEPSTLHEIINEAISLVRTDKLYNRALRQEARERAELELLATQYDTVKETLDKTSMAALIARNMGKNGTTI